MEETLGKRIVSHRKGLGLTQDALAELLGVTAQAVSKWENDQSCPDITMLPRLAEIFHTTTDALLGVAPRDVPLPQPIPESPGAEPEKPRGPRMAAGGGLFELQWDGGRKSSVGFAVWVLLVGLLLLGSHFDYPLPMRFSLWELLWTSALFTFGIFGLFPRFSFFRFGCAFFGGYFLLETGGLLGNTMHEGLMIAIIVLLFGLGLLFEALRKPSKGTFHMALPFTRRNNHCTYDGGHFDCATSFGENHYLIQLSPLAGGSAEVSFGEMTVDLSGCVDIAPNCHLQLSSSFGDLELLVPRSIRIEPASSTAFASMDIKGDPAPDAVHTITADCRASFGQITIRYL